MTRYINAHRQRFGVEPICEVLQVAPSMYYSAKKRPPCRRRISDEKLKSEIRRVFEENYAVYGARKVWRRASAAALVDAQNELATYRELYAEPMVLLAEAVLRHARSEPPDAVREVLHRAATRATASGGYAVAARVRATAGRLGYAV